jgi:pantoate--beta-alanine ligase
VHPNRAYFGEKDWQQLQLVRDMAAAFFFDTEIVACPTVREADGLAMSSRNVHLEADQRRLAPTFHRVIDSGATPDEMQRVLESAGFEVDYVERCGDRVLGAVRLGKVRLIDNARA